MKNTVLTLTTLATLVSTSLVGTVNSPAHAHNIVPLNTVSNQIDGCISDSQFYSQVRTFIDAEDFNGLFQYSSSVISAAPAHAKAFYFRALSRFELQQSTALIIKDLDNAIFADGCYVDALMARASMLDSINNR